MEILFITYSVQGSDGHDGQHRFRIPRGQKIKQKKLFHNKIVFTYGCFGCESYFEIFANRNSKNNTDEIGSALLAYSLGFKREIN
jgi:hypothetical protein